VSWVLPVVSGPSVEAIREAIRGRRGALGGSGAGSSDFAFDWGRFTGSGRGCGVSTRRVRGHRVTRLVWSPHADG
jgi:hypothetical protein